MTVVASPDLQTAAAVADLDAQLEGLVAAGRHYHAWARLRDRLWDAPTPWLEHRAAAWADRLDRGAAGLRTVRLALLGSFTLDPLVPVLKARALASGIALDTYVGAFNGWRQEALDERSGLHAFRPDVIVLALQAADVVPALVHRFLQLDERAIEAEIEAAATALDEFLAAVRTGSPAKVVVHSLPVPVHRALGIVDHRLPAGQVAAFRRLAARWADVAASAGDTWVLDCERLIMDIGWQRWHDPRFAALARLPLSSAALQRLAEEHVTYLRAFVGLVRKVLVLDLDNTLWGGVLGEDGMDGLQLGSEYPGSAFVEVQRVVAALHDRGVLLALNSKNEEADALAVLEGHPGMVLRPQHFAAWRINWSDKAANLGELADELNLSLESFVFVDDNPVECERVRQAVPQVLTLPLAGDPAGRAERLRRLAVFDTLQVSAEDRARSAMYRAGSERRQLKARMPSLEEFYTSLEMRLTIRRVDAAQRARAAQLTQRTNQFNVTTRRYTEDAIEALLHSADHDVYSAQISDRFGDEGIIALAILRQDEDVVLVDTFLMSCRVIGRTVETALLTFLAARAAARGAKSLIGRYCPTAKNSMCADLYARHGFHETERPPEAVVSQLPLQGFVATYPRWFHLTVPEE